MPEPVPSRNPVTLPESVTLIVQLQARQGQEAALEQELLALLVPTREEEGCLGFTLHRSIETPGMFMLHEVWSSREHHTRHTETPHFQRWNTRKDALLTNRIRSFWKVIR
jgi:quinol monooxygenase YgiN